MLMNSQMQGGGDGVYLLITVTYNGVLRTGLNKQELVNKALFTIFVIVLTELYPSRSVTAK